MLKVAREKTTSFANVCFVEADAGRLPFADGTFDAVTCSHAFYELKGETQERALQEIVRVLRPSGAFLMMEHDVPSNPFVRALFYLRLTFIGGGRAIAFLRHEQEVLERHFAGVEKVMAPAGRSKVMICQKRRAAYKPFSKPVVISSKETQACKQKQRSQSGTEVLFCSNAKQLTKMMFRS
jgi:demethylmenaquinone methyltransferase/2-methoxy-6-polyprenyl-1,4-benzoquinol methylase